MSKYAKSVLNSAAYKQYSGQNKNNFQKFLDVAEIAVAGNKLINNNISQNIKDLEESKEFDKVELKKNIKFIDQFAKYDEEIQNIYNGDVNAWSRAFARDKFKQDVLSKSNLTESQKEQAISFPNKYYDADLDAYATKVADNWRSIQNELDTIGLPTTSLDDAEEYIDESYADFIRDLSKSSRVNLLKEGFNFLTGKGININNYEDLEAKFNDNALAGKFNQLESIDKKFKSLFLISPELSAAYEDAVSKADFRADVSQSYSELYEKEYAPDADGNIFKQRGRDFVVTYTDARTGELKQEIKFIPEDSNAEKRIKEISVTTEQAQLLLNEEGFQQYINLSVTSGNPNKAFTTVFGQDKYRENVTQNEKRDFIEKNYAVLEQGWMSAQNNYKDLTGGFRPDIRKYLEDPVNNPKPGDFFESYEDFVNDRFSLLDSKVNTSSVSYNENYMTIDSTSFNSEPWQEFMMSDQGNNFIQDLKDSVGSESELQRAEELFVEGSGSKIIYGDSTVTSNQIKQISGSSVPAGNYRVGFNLEESKPVFSPIDADFNDFKEAAATPVTNFGDVKLNENEVQSIFDAPFQAVEEFIIGDEYDLSDLLWLVPIGGGAYGATKLAWKLGKKGVQLGKKGVNRVLNSISLAVKKADKKLGELYRTSTKKGKVMRDEKGRVLSYEETGKSLRDPVTKILVGKTKTGKFVRLTGAAAIGKSVLEQGNNNENESLLAPEEDEKKN